MALPNPKELRRILLGPLLSDDTYMKLESHLCRLDALAHYGPRCYFCGDKDQDHLKFMLAATLENVSAHMLERAGYPHRFWTKEGWRLSTVLVVCPRCARILRREQYYGRLDEPSPRP